MTKRYQVFHDRSDQSGVEDMHAKVRTIMAYVPLEQVHKVEALMNTAYEAGQEHTRAKMRAALGLGEEPK